MRLAKAFAAGRKKQGNHRQHCYYKYLYVHLTLLGIDKLLIQETDSVADIPTVQIQIHFTSNQFVLGHSAKKNLFDKDKVESSICSLHSQ